MLFAIIAISEDTLPRCANLKLTMLLTTYWWVLPLALWLRAVYKFAMIIVFLSLFARSEPRNRFPSARSLWRAQVLVVHQSNAKKRLCVDYSVTINRYTYLAQDTFYSSLDLKSTYHQVPLAPEERPMTAFEADGRLFQYCRLPFGVTNGVSAFQRAMDDFIKRHGLKKVS